GRIVSGLARLSPAEPGERQGYWLRAVASMQTRDTPSPEPVSEQWRRRFVLESAVLPGTGPALLPGMVMGDRSAQGPELDSAMKTAGLAHLTAVSGANVAMILGSVLWLCRFCGVNRWLALGASLVTLVGFVILVHPEPSVIRAAVMGAVGAVAVYLGRGRQALTALCVCVCGVLAWDPWFAREPAFQLSVLATAGIVLMGARLGALARRIMPGWLADGVAISTSAQLFCLPVLLGMNPAFSLYAVPANVLAAPLVPLVTVAGMSALLLCAVPGPWAQPLIWLAGIPADWIGMLGRLVHGLPGALLPWPEGSGGRGAAVLLALMALVAVWLAATPAAEAGPHPGRWAWLRPFAAAAGPRGPGPPPEQDAGPSPGPPRWGAWAYWQDSRFRQQPGGRTRPGRGRSRAATSGRGIPLSCAPPPIMPS
ncbi:MAG: ComEC/Rec2 family competence protein, partial [Micrococcaceae bacterium]|nr:ComEC/Rec2 family competence protein [Micrococcaceae bacterium]